MFVSLVACEAGSNVSEAGAGPPAMLTPLAPRTYELDTPHGRIRNDYFTVDQPRRDDPQFRATLLRLVRERHRAADAAPAVHSVYVYTRTQRLNPQFSGTVDDLRGVFDADLVFYGRWTAGVNDVAWLIDRGNVVRDLLTDRLEEPPFEFD